MRKYLNTALLLSVVLLLLGSCSAPVQQEKALKYPRKPLDNPERKSGLPMLFYEAAEENADPSNIIVTPPEKKEERGVTE